MTVLDPRAAPAAAGDTVPAVGRRRPRSEDRRLVSGRGRYLADHAVPGLCHVAIARATLAHATVCGVDTAAATAVPGVVAVVTAADLAAAGARTMSHLLAPPAHPLRWGLLASDRVRYVGEPLVAVVATSRAVAEDALELLDVTYGPLDPVVGVEAALAPGAALLYPEWGTNEMLHLDDLPDGLDAALDAAPHRLTERYESHRLVGLPLEGHGVQATWDGGAGRLGVWSSSQQPHQLRTVVAEVCGLAETAVRVVSPDIGGGFGNKQHFTREECLVAMLARMTGRTVRWTQDRTEALVASVHARAQVHHVDAGYDDAGRVLALRVQVLSDLGNPTLYFSGVGPALVTVGCLGGAYSIAHLGWSLSAVATTTCPVGAYRGFGQPEAHLTTERVMDRVASALGMDPVEVRRVNLIPDSPRPWWGHGGRRIDAGPLHPQLDLLVAEMDVARWRTRRAEGRAAGRFVGIGVSTLLHGTTPNQHGTAGRFGSMEMASVTVLPDGAVTVRVGTKSQGQGHETAFAQVAADALGTDPSSVTVSDGDTDALPYGQGTWGSRSMVMGSGAITAAAADVRARMTAIGAAIGLVVAPSGPVDPGVFTDVARVAWWDQHRLAPGDQPGLSAVAVYTPGRTGPGPDGRDNHDETYGSHAMGMVVEVDPATGDVTVLDAVVVADCGRLINPMLVEGQILGGFAQGLGAALFEEVRYADDGRPLSTSLYDYSPPGSLDVPALRIVFRPTPSDLPGGYRGVGEAAIISTPAVLVGAVEDALAPLGVTLSGTRLHAAALRRAVAATGWRPDAATWAARTPTGYQPVVPTNS